MSGVTAIEHYAMKANPKNTGNVKYKLQLQRDREIGDGRTFPAVRTSTPFSMRTSTTSTRPLSAARIMTLYSF